MTDPSQAPAVVDRMRVRSRALTTLLVLGVTLVTLGGTTACMRPGRVGDAAEAPPSASATAAGSATRAPGSAGAAPTAQPPVDADRALAHIRMLASDIGVRAAGTDAERRAARYIADTLTAAGYTATLETFTFPSRFDESTVRLPGGPVTALAMDGSASGNATGVLVDGGVGGPEEIPAAARGAVLIVRRGGGVTFAQKAANARAAGAVAVVVVNSDAGPLRGTLGPERTAIPVVGVEGSNDASLRAALGRAVTVESNAGTRTITSQNVVGRRGDTCRWYIGAHYDSVAQGPGANDNASGTASMLEIARVRGTDGLCAIAFGAEELGLFGSQAFVAAHSARDARFMLNFDMMGRIDGAMIVGDSGLTRRILGILGQGPDQPLRPGVFPPFTSSDHVSFTAAGTAAVTITAGDDPAMHTPEDRTEAIRRADLATLLRLGDAALGGLLAAPDLR